MSIVGRNNAAILSIDIMKTGDKMFNGIPSIREFISTTIEWHTIWNGFCHSFYKPKWFPKSVKEQMSQEYHYYSTGRMAGHIAKAVIFTAIAVMIIRRHHENKL